MSPDQLHTIKAVWDQSQTDAYGFMRLMEKYQVQVLDVMAATGLPMSAMKQYFYGMGGAPDGWRGLESNFTASTTTPLSGISTTVILGVAGVAAFLLLRK